MKMLVKPIKGLLAPRVLDSEPEPTGKTLNKYTCLERRGKRDSTKNPLVEVELSAWVAGKGRVQ